LSAQPVVSSEEALKEAMISCAPSRPTGTREIEILLACARLNLEEEDVRRIRNLLLEEPDWDQLLRLAVFHRLTAFVYLNLCSAASDLVPQKILEFLKGRFVQNAGEALRHTAELVRVLELLNDNGVLAVPYKGPELASRVYGNLALRWSCDLDIIVKKQDVSRARVLLENAGFYPRYPTSRSGQQFLVRNRHSDIFLRDGGPVIELHWAFVDGETSFPVRLEQLQARLQESSIGGSKVLVFAPEDLLLILCVHGATHRWDRLEWLCGVVELIRGRGVQWQEVLDRAAKHRVDKTLLLGLLLGHDLLEAPVSDRIVTRARADHDVVYLSRLVQETLALGEIQPAPVGNVIQRDLFRLRLQSTISDRLRYFFYRFTTPGKRDDTRHMVPLGRWSVPLPTFVRPFLVIGKVISESFPKKTSQERNRQRNS
jgi:hypothetical protein